MKKVVECEFSLSKILDKIEGMRVINNITTFAKMNNKAAELCEFCQEWNRTLFLSPEEWKMFTTDIRKKIDDLNAKYPRARKFEVYSETKEWLHVCVKDRPDESVVRISITPIKRVYLA